MEAGATNAFGEFGLREKERPDLKDIVFEVARDTGDPLAASPPSHPPPDAP